MGPWLTAIPPKKVTKFVPGEGRAAVLAGKPTVDPFETQPVYQQRLADLTQSVGAVQENGEWILPTSTVSRLDVREWTTSHHTQVDDLNCFS